MSYPGVAMCCVPNQFPKLLQRIMELALLRYCSFQPRRTASVVWRCLALIFTAFALGVSGAVWRPCYCLGLVYYSRVLPSQTRQQAS